MTANNDSCGQCPARNVLWNRTLLTTHIFFAQCTAKTDSLSKRAFLQQPARPKSCQLPVYRTFLSRVNVPLADKIPQISCAAYSSTLTGELYSMQEAARSRNRKQEAGKAKATTNI
jgi:hypothetical protein